MGCLLHGGFADGGVAVAAGLEDAAAAAEEAVEFVDEEICGLVGVFGGDAGEQVGAADFDVALGDEDLAAASGVEFEVDAHAVDAGLVTEEAVHLGVEGVAHGVGEGEVNAAQEQLGRGGVGNRFRSVIVYHGIN